MITDAVYKNIKNRVLNWNDSHEQWLCQDRTSKVTIITTVHNRTIELERAILSIIQQDYPHWELLILGDRCKKETFQVAQQYQDQYTNKIIFFNFKRVDEKTHRGTEQRNFASKFIIQTPYTAYLDDDNYWYCQHLSGLVKLIEKENLDFVYGGIEDRSKYAPHQVYKYRKTEEYSWKARRADTSSLLHKSELIPKYAVWSERADMNVDLRLIESFRKHNLKHKGLSLVTMAYFAFPKFDDPTGYNLDDYLVFTANQVKQQKSGVPL